MNLIDYRGSSRSAGRLTSHPGSQPVVSPTVPMSYGVLITISWDT